MAIKLSDDEFHFRSRTRHIAVEYFNYLKEEVDSSQDDKITQYDLTHSYVSTKREGKPGHWHPRWRGEEQTKYFANAIFREGGYDQVECDDDTTTRDVFRLNYQTPNDELTEEAMRRSDVKWRGKEK